MKITKVNHVKSAVGLKAGEKIEGILYQDPSSNSKETTNNAKTITTIADGRIKSAKVLYSVLNPYKADDQDQTRNQDKNQDKNKNKKKDGKKAGPITDKAQIENLKKLCGREINQAIREFLGKKKPCLSQEYADQLVETVRKSVKEHTKDLDKETVDTAVKRFLKKSLKTSRASGLMKKLLNPGEELTSEEKLTLLDILIKDYNRVKVRDTINKSITHQNMVVQPDREGVLTLSKSPSDGSDIRPVAGIKAREKAGLEKFLNQYASLDSSERTELLRKLRRIVDLYFYGEESVASGNFNVWADHESRKSCDDLFIDLAEKDGTGPIKGKIQRENIARYRYCKEKIAENPGLYFDDEPEVSVNMFWVHHIENVVEQIYLRFGREVKNSAAGNQPVPESKEKNSVAGNQPAPKSKENIRNRPDLYKLKKGYLSEKVWKYLLNYLSVKYIAIGKAVYNFAHAELSDAQDNAEPSDAQDNRNIGELPKEVLKGITSFDYELIKAEETLQRETAVYTAFAINHFWNATTDITEGSDLFDGNTKPLKTHLGRRILQYFGGISKWPEELGFNQDGKAEALWGDIRSALFAMRNENFHFKTRKKDSSTSDTITELFSYDCRTAARLKIEKLYSNNLPMFYSEKDLGSLAAALYSNYVPRASQVPAFNSVFVRKSFPDYVRQDLGIDVGFLKTGEEKVKYYNALYYLLKEIYYCRFLASKKSRKLFTSSVLREKNAANKNSGKGDNRKSKEERAAIDFHNRIMAIKAGPYLAEVCQSIMTEQNMQNQGKRKVEADKENPPIYQHYKMLLLKNLRNAFVQFVKSEDQNDHLGLTFIYHPRKLAMMDKERFLPDQEVRMYSTLPARLRENAELQKWYVLGRFLSPKQQNMLVGTVRHYQQYSKDVERRARQTGNKIYEGLIVDRKYLDHVAEILDMCITTSGVTSNIVSDYFDDGNEYASYVMKFVNCGNAADLSDAEKLKNFCNEEILPGQVVGLYYDGENPILNRNILMAKLYGSESLVAKALSQSRNKVTKSKIKELFSCEKRISSYRGKGICDSEEEQKELKRYQELRNRIELRDIAEYMEIVNELQGQLINWCYLRERDLMYYQLGFHYTCLQDRDRRLPEAYRRVTCNGKSIDNAVLYQLVAMYIYGLPMISLKKDSVQLKGEGLQTSAKIGQFLRYTKDAAEQGNFAGEAKKMAPGRPIDELFYMAGLELFEDVDEHEDIINLRNSIDHFHFFSGSTERSMISYYSEIFDRFFTYDMKYRKNVPNMLSNILSRHFIDVNFKFSSTEKKVGENVTKPAAEVRFRKGVKSSQFTYKLKDNKETKLHAKSKEFIYDVMRLLYYPEAFPE